VANVDCEALRERLRLSQQTGGELEAQINQLKATDMTSIWRSLASKAYNVALEVALRSVRANQVAQLEFEHLLNSHIQTLETE
jgi:hypothetical protein